MHALAAFVLNRCCICKEAITIEYLKRTYAQAASPSCLAACSDLTETKLLLSTPTLIPKTAKRLGPRNSGKRHQRNDRFTGKHSGLISNKTSFEYHFKLPPDFWM
ncbi:MAG: recombinational DNA repair protein (RecF pathway) [Cryomorphaceae bacterium]|jgi:hypothetical protein